MMECCEATAQLIIELIINDPVLLGLLAAFFGFAAAYFLFSTVLVEITASMKYWAKKSYEKETAIYEDKPIIQPIISGIALEDLLQDDGEIPDKFLGGGK